MLPKLLLPLRVLEYSHPLALMPEPFLSTLQNMGVKFLRGVENFQQGEVLFVQTA